MSSKTKVRLFVGVIAAAMFSTTVMAQAKTDTASTTTIGGITDLQRRVLVAELNKKLRDANAVDKGSAGSGTSTFPSAPVPGGAIVALPSPRKKVASAPVSPKEDIRVVAISGVGTALQATLSNGQTVKAGQKFFKNGETWEVVLVNSSFVRLKQCGDKAACKEVTLPVVSS